MLIAAYSDNVSMYLVLSQNIHQQATDLNFEMGDLTSRIKCVEF